MRLICWAQQFYPYIGGIEVLTAGALPHLKKRGFDCSVITSQGPLQLPEEDHYETIPVYRFPFLEALESKNPQQIHLIVGRIAKLEREFAPHLVHVFLSDPSCLFHLLARRSHKSFLIVSVHNTIVDQISAEQSLFRKVLTAADWVVGNSEFTLERIRKAVPECVNKSSVIYSGVLEASLRPAELPLDPVRIACLGRLVEEKGFDLAVEMTANLIQSRGNVFLQIIGDGPARTSLERLVAERGIQEFVEFVGWVNPDRIYSFLNSATVVVVPSRWEEPLCQVAIQASLMARPIVATRTGGLPEVVLHGETGLLVEPNNSAALAYAMEALLSDIGRARRMGALGKERMESMFSMTSYIDALETLYKRVAESGKRSGE